MFIADAHCDTLYAIALENKKPWECAVTEKSLREGGIGLQTFALFAGPEGSTGHPLRNARAMLSTIEKLNISFLKDNLPDSPPQKPMGILSCEGGEIFKGSLEVFNDLQDIARFRMVALTWNNENELGYSAVSGNTQGLKPFGRKLLREMNRRGVLPDTSHLNEAGFWEICEHSSLPPIASHSNCRWLCDTPRNLTKAQVKALIERNGYIGINFFSDFLKSDGNVTLDDVIRHIDALFEMGAENIAGFGSDFDGIDRWPETLSSPATFPRLIEALSRRGYTQPQLKKLAGLNLWRILKQAEKTAGGAYE